MVHQQSNSIQSEEILISELSRLERNTDHNPQREPGNDRVLDGESREIERSDMARERLRDGAERVLANRSENGGSGEVPELLRFDTELNEEIAYAFDRRDIVFVSGEVRSVTLTTVNFDLLSEGPCIARRFQATSKGRGIGGFSPHMVRPKARAPRHLLGWIDALNGACGTASQGHVSTYQSKSKLQLALPQGILQLRVDTGNTNRTTTVHQFHNVGDITDFTQWLWLLGFPVLEPMTNSICDNLCHHPLPTELRAIGNFSSVQAKAQLIPDRCFMWRLLLNRIPTRTNLSKRGVNTPSLLCPLCNLEEETVDHLFCSCSAAKDLWKWMCDWCMIKVEQPASLNQMLLKVLEFGKSIKWRKFLETAVGGLIGPPFGGHGAILKEEVLPSIRL
ncbi:hypothetical protein OSB04_005174 [Centaurea solstitialis]|uniref:Reverse transcriptase zinc-binding domain-containing protein n=1 Tax=Centaurea solstitialis TaxID=347529 RepID=A0AA38WRA2_9ASTR|nr:hypothetical protein OSB04_005174 [Centaurea solstitialis]